MLRLGVDDAVDATRTRLLPHVQVADANVDVSGALHRQPTRDTHPSLLTHAKRRRERRHDGRDTVMVPSGPLECSV